MILSWSRGSTCAPAALASLDTRQLVHRLLSGQYPQRHCVHGGVIHEPSGSTPRKPTLVVTQAVASASTRLSTPNWVPAGTRITSPHYLLGPARRRWLGWSR